MVSPIRPVQIKARVGDDCKFVVYNKKDNLGTKVKLESLPLALRGVRPLSCLAEPSGFCSGG